MRKKADKLSKRSRRSWYFYDMGNSAYASIVLLAVYSAYFKNVVVGGAEGTRLWGISVGLAAIIVAVISPLLGTIADVTQAKKKFLFAFTVLSCVFTALLFFAREGDVFMAMAFFVLAEIGYRGSQVFYDALLVDVSTPETVGSVSGKGWATGMLGGIISLIIVLIPIQLIGNSMVPYAFLFTAAFYMLFAIPTFLWAGGNQKKTIHTPRQKIFGVAARKLYQTFKDIKHYKEFIKYAVAFLIYNDGIMMLMDFAAIIGATLFGMGQVQLILFVIMIHITGTFGALLFGRISDKKSSRDSIVISLIVLIASLTGLFFITNITWFFVIGALAGFSLTGAQAVSRAMVSQLAPPAKATEFYGFLSVAGRTSTFIGPLVFGTISYRVHNWYVNHGVESLAAEKLGLLWAIASIIAFLLIGMTVLLFVKRVSSKEPIVYSHEGLKKEAELLSKI